MRPTVFPAEASRSATRSSSFRAFFAKEWLRSLFHLLIDPRITTASMCQQWSKSYLLVLLVEDTASILNLSGSPQVRSNNVVYCGIPYTSVYPIINHLIREVSYYWVYHINMLFNHDSLLPVWKRNAIGRESVPNWARLMAWSAPWLREIWESPSVVLPNGWAVLRKSLQNLSPFMLFTCILYTTVIYCSKSKYFDWFSSHFRWLTMNSPRNTMPVQSRFWFPAQYQGRKMDHHPNITTSNQKKPSTHHFLWIFQICWKKIIILWSTVNLVPDSPYFWRSTNRQFSSPRNPNALTAASPRDRYTASVQVAFIHFSWAPGSSPRWS